ncbi:MAG: relaxase/mobilization nuclease domain-containing protein [Coriobacteriia bacterium]|nr:relaxase/mobilization nuclease domain-containing protein [Coriobacteriia bacterium]
MAITKIFPVRQRFDHVLSYITDEAKTVGSTLVTGINCAPETAYESMSASFALNDKPLRVQGYHIIQSFAKDEVSPVATHEIGVKLAKRLFGESFQVVVSTHLNTGIIHNHIALCSTSFIDGHRYHSCKTSYQQIRETSDSFCSEHGLSVIENPRRGRYKSTAEVKAERSGNKTWLSIIKADVDEAITKATSSKQFLANLQRLGYEVKVGKDISVKPSGKERFVRLARNLGDGYTHESITQRILNQTPQKRVIPRQSHSVEKPRKLPKFARGSLFALYRHYLYLLGYWQKQSSSSNTRIHYLLRDDIRKLDAFIEDARLLKREGIVNRGQLDGFYHRTSRAIEELVDERKSLYSARLTD